jgi:iron complex transport system substrate-binding protein
VKKSIKKHIFFAPLRLCGKNLALILIFCIFFTACKSANTQTKVEAQPTKTDSATREITDDLGRRVKIPEKVERAVSLAPNLTEIVFAVGAGERLVGVTTFCNYPEETKKIQKIGDTMNPNIENIIALKPQIVLISTAAQIETFTKVLDEQGIVYFVTNPQNLDGIYKSINTIGEIFGRKEKADEVVTNLKKRVAGVESRIVSERSVKTFLQISKEPLYTIGKESFITDLIKRAGGVSATETVETAYPKLSKETALSLNPDAIILSESEDNQTPNEVFKNSPAVKNARVFKINADIISRPAPRVVDVLEQLARALHPESFK